MLELTNSLFPRFTRRAANAQLENVLSPASLVEIAELEEELGIPLPGSYKQLLQCARGFGLLDGVVQFGSEHPFCHDFEPLEQLSPTQQEVVLQKGGGWPPPSDGMLCFADFFMEADGDQVLFDTRQGLVNGEYPIVYYSHDSRPPSIRVLANSFSEFMEQFLEYDAFSE